MWTSLRIYIYKIVDFINGLSGLLYRTGWTSVNGILIKSYENYSVLAHMDLIIRYDNDGVYSFEKIKNKITEILKIVISDGKGIELNTSSKRYGLSDSTPCRVILTLYYNLGGNIITIGSDSHKPEHLGAYIQEGKELLRSIGFTQYCTFEKMKPIFHSL